MNSTTSPFNSMATSQYSTMSFIVKQKKAYQAENTFGPGFIVALVCFAIGAILLIIGFIKITWWFFDTRKQEKFNQWWLRELERRRHLEEYSKKTDGKDQVQNELTNQGFIHDEEEHEGIDNKNKVTKCEEEVMLPHYTSGSCSQISSQIPETSDNEKIQKENGTIAGKDEMDEVIEYL